MSERASFTSEYIYSWDDYKKVRAALDKKSKYLCIAAPVDWGAGELPIVQGKVGELSYGMEYYTLVSALEGVQVDDDVDFVVMSDSAHSIVLVRLYPTGDVDYWALGVAEEK